LTFKNFIEQEIKKKAFHKEIKKVFETKKKKERYG